MAQRLEVWMAVLQEHGLVQHILADVDGPGAAVR